MLPGVRLGVIQKHEAQVKAETGKLKTTGWRYCATSATNASILFLTGDLREIKNSDGIERVDAKGES
jgi:hypothetical protein